MNKKTKKVVVFLIIIAILIALIGGVNFYQYLKQTTPPNLIESGTSILYG